MLEVTQAVAGRNAGTELDAVFKAYDIRGHVPEQLDAALCRAIGAAFARFAAAPRLVVGHDMRRSGDELAAAFCDGARREGATVTLLGLVSTDLVYYAAGKLASPGAMITASHNPAQYNGIKLCLAGARPVGLDTGLSEIKVMAEAIRDGRISLARQPVGGVESLDLLDDFADHVVSFVDRSRLKPLKVIADTANGMGGLVVPKVFDAPSVRPPRHVRRARRHVPEPPRRPDPAGESARSARARDRHGC